jgi:putative FmdB family regulatory protein
MPIYEYKCKGCGEILEVIQKFSDAPLTIHESCGGEMERLLSPSAFQFKGTGWYVTDYARNSKTPAGANGKPETAAEAGAASKSETKAESKSETKSETKGEAKPSSAPANN